MQPFQPFYNLNFERFFSPPTPSSQYAQSPQPFVLGEGDVASVVNPNGSFSFFFVPVLKPWLTLLFNPSMPSYVHPYWYTDSGVWVIRSVSNPMPWNIFLQMIQKICNLNEHSNKNPLVYQNSPLLEISQTSQQSMEQHPLQFHNDCVTSTTDLHYFCPRPNMSVNTLRMDCDCSKINEVEMNTPMNTPHRLIEADAATQFNMPQQTDMDMESPLRPNQMEARPKFSPPQKVVCSRPCYCVHMPNTPYPMNAFSFREPFQTGISDYATKFGVNCNTAHSINKSNGKQYISSDWKSDKMKSRSQRKSSKSSSSETLSDCKSYSSKKTFASKHKKKGQCERCENIKKTKSRSSHHSEACRCAKLIGEDEYKQKRQRCSNHLFSNKNRNTVYATYSNSSIEEQPSPDLDKTIKKECNQKTCPARKEKNTDSVCTDHSCPILKKKQDSKRICNKKTCTYRKKKGKESKSKPIKLESSCNNDACPGRPTQQDSTSSYEGVGAEQYEIIASSSSNDNGFSVRREKSIDSIYSCNFQVAPLPDESQEKESSEQCKQEFCQGNETEKPRDSDDTQTQEDVNCDPNICDSQSRVEEDACPVIEKSKSNVMFVKKDDVQKSCSDCSYCSSCNQTRKKPFSWRSYIVPTKLVSVSNKKTPQSIRHSKCSCSKHGCSYKSYSKPSTYKKQFNCNNAQLHQKNSDQYLCTAGMKYKPHICGNMGPRFLIGQRRKEEPHHLCCSSTSVQDNDFLCNGFKKFKNSLGPQRTTLDKHITTYNDNATNCYKVTATQTKKCKCHKNRHKKDLIKRGVKKNYKAELWEPKFNCDFNCQQFLLELRGSVPCLYNKNK